MDINEIRLRKINILLDSCSSRKDMAEKITKDSGILMDPDLLGKYVTTGKSNKRIGDVIARRIEKVFGKPYGWMDWVDPDWIQMPLEKSSHSPQYWPFPIPIEDYKLLSDKTKRMIYSHMELFAKEDKEEVDKQSKKTA
jgi:hypothetical protein